MSVINKRKIELLLSNLQVKLNKLLLDTIGESCQNEPTFPDSTQPDGRDVSPFLYCLPSNGSQEERAAEQLLDNVFELLNIYNQRFSANDTNSELMQVNHAAGKHPVPVDPELFELIQIGPKEQSLQPASHLNIAIGPLVQTWAESVLTTRAFQITTRSRMRCRLPIHSSLNWIL